MWRGVFILTLCASAFTASAAWYPVIDLTYLRVEVGETRTVTVRAVWTGWNLAP